MKKLITLMLVFLISSCFIKGQKQNYIDSAKKDTLTISMILTDKQTPVVKDLQKDLAKSVENQSKVTINLADVLISLNNGIIAFTKEIEQRNKSDSMLITDYFNYSTDKVKKVMKRQNIIQFISWICLLLFAFTVVRIRAPNDKKYTPSVWFVFFILNGIVGALIFFTIKVFGTYIFNPDYLIIKNILGMYT